MAIPMHEDRTHEVGQSFPLQTECHQLDMMIFPQQVTEGQLIKKRTIIADEGSDRGKRESTMRKCHGAVLLKKPRREELFLRRAWLRFVFLRLYASIRAEESECRTQVLHCQCSKQ